MPANSFPISLFLSISLCKCMTGTRANTHIHRNTYQRSCTTLSSNYVHTPAGTEWPFCFQNGKGLLKFYYIHIVPHVSIHIPTWDWGRAGPCRTGTDNKFGHSLCERPQPLVFYFLHGCQMQIIFYVHPF
jgi:hypothetical protein